MKAANTFLLLLALLILACYFEELGVENNSDSSSSQSLHNSSSSQAIVLQESIEYQGQTYRTIKMGSTVWFAENLNAMPKSGKFWCNGNLLNRCKEYGRLYDWEAAMNVCPDKWKLPGKAEFDSLSNFGGDVLSTNAAWWNATFGGFKEENYGDEEGFSDLTEGYWWSSEEAPKNLAGYGYITVRGGGLKYGYKTKERAFSVRCVKK